ncbi:MAG: D-aminoacyl-tRNA deacylase [Eubacteriaceae bacterium]|nr:D-aminoacyl-tRNA deacylase [Eubacteriaceae bacterium]
MKALLQRSKNSLILAGGETIAEISHGLVVFAGFGPNDSQETAMAMAKKIAGLRIFEDSSGKMNKSILQTGGEILLASQFTLYAETKKSGMRPSFSSAMEYGQAQKLFALFSGMLEGLGVATKRGIFGADLLVSIENDGPVTILLENDP